MAEVQILTLSCRDRPGITARVTGYLFEHGSNVLEAQQFNDQDEGSFFMRVEFDPGEGDVARIGRGFAPLAEEYGMHWTLRSKAARRKTLLLVSKFDHCLADLLYRLRIGELPMDVVGIVCNHPAEVLVHTNIRDIPFHHLPITRDTKPQQESAPKPLVEETGAKQTNLSNHLKVLREAGLVDAEPCGRFTYYKLRPEVLAGLSGRFAELAASARTAAENKRACP